jgi:hypothetical protein
MDARLTSEKQRQLRDAAAKLADDLGPGTVQDLSDQTRIARLEEAVETTGWRSLRSDGASGVEVAIVAEEFGRGLVDVAFLGAVLADDVARHIDVAAQRATIAAGWGSRLVATDARGCTRGLQLRHTTLRSVDLDNYRTGTDLTRVVADSVGTPTSIGEVSQDAAGRWLALGLAATSAELVGVARGVHAVTVDYAKMRAQYGKSIGSYQAVAHPLAEGSALIEGSISIARHAAWAVDALPESEALHAARMAKIYCARATRTVCETAIQVHGGIGNTWECIVHVYLRRALASTELFPAELEEISHGLS